MNFTNRLWRHRIARLLRRSHSSSRQSSSHSRQPPVPCAPPPSRSSRRPGPSRRPRGSARAPTLRRAGDDDGPKSGAYLEKDAEGLYYVALEHESGASAKAFVYGADVTSYKDASGTEWIAVRPDAKMDGSKPISGGLSHCFPQFGPGAIQQHGFARNVDWDIMWDEPFVVDFEVALSAASLDTKMTVTNTGSGDSFDFQAALHSYFDVSDINATSIAGSFKGKTFLDKMQDPPKETKETRDVITVGEEYDRVYKGSNDPVLKDKGKGKALTIDNKAGWKDTVLWSPYGDEGMGYKNFLCVESVAFDPVSLAAGETGRRALARARRALSAQSIAPPANHDRARPGPATRV
ncbi:glucose-6-phosphate 1-epimerase [Aureococcus anophagefferens]|nr:glucose-6-phosphate 1-epimerase [Aureococcus anophagefferens]